MSAGCSKPAITAPTNKLAYSDDLTGLTTRQDPQTKLNLGTAADFTILTETGITTTGVTSIDGNMGVSPISSTAMTGFSLAMDATNLFSISPLVTNGKVYGPDYAGATPAKMTQAVADMETAFTQANLLTSTYIASEAYAGDVSGQTLYGGLYKWSTGVMVTGAGVTLKGGPTDVFVFQIAGDLVISNNAIIHLVGVLPSNVFWVVSGAAKFGTNADFSGTILSKTLVSLNTGDHFTGHLYAQTAVTMIANTVVTGAKQDADYEASVAAQSSASN